MAIHKRVCVLVGAIVWLLGGAQAALAGSGVRHSVHDFTDNNGTAENDDSYPFAWNNKRKELCRVCHVPHDHGEVRYGNLGILWNHQTTTKASWDMYASDSNMLDWIDGDIAPAPVGTSKMCLGCHDGVSAINQYDGKTPLDPGYGNGWTVMMDDYAPIFEIGNTPASLTNNHPISVVYDNLNDTQLRDPATATMSNGDTVQSLLIQGRVECSTCHDVHNKESVTIRLLRSGTYGTSITGAGASELCFVCHDK